MSEAIVVRPETSDPAQLLALAVEKGLDPATLEKMMVLAERWHAGQARKAFDKIVTEFPIASGPYVAGATEFGRDISYDRNPDYYSVCSGTTGHAEVVQVTYDPAIVSFRDLLEVLFTIHDPTTLNRQGNDVGTQYRSGIYYVNDAQKETAERARAVGRPVLSAVQRACGVGRT